VGIDAPRNSNLSNTPIPPSVEIVRSSAHGPLIEIFSYSHLEIAFLRRDFFSMKEQDSQPAEASAGQTKARPSRD
jgi:hypothetical protein